MRRMSELALVLVIAAMPVGDADAYCLNKFTGTTPYAAWGKFPVTYRVSNDLKDTKLLAAIDKAFAEWAAVDCSKLSFKKGEAFDRGAVAFEHKEEAILVFWYPSEAGYPSDKQYASYSFVGHNNAGRLTRGSIAINAFNYEWSDSGEANKIDLQSEMTGYIGYVLGLDTSNDGNSVMKRSISFGDTSKRKLMQDDRDAIHYLYNESGCPAPPQPGSNGCTGSTPAADSGTPAQDASTPAKRDAGGPATDSGRVDSGGAPRLDSGTSSGCTHSDQCGAGAVCTSEGVCIYTNSCTNSAQCGAGEVCTTEGRCIKQAEDGGCALGAAKGRALVGYVWIMIALGAWMRGRRRRQG